VDSRENSRCQKIGKKGKWYQWDLWHRPFTDTLEWSKRKKIRGKKEG
jgi:hypothetical protein